MQRKAGEFWRESVLLCPEMIGGLKGVTRSQIDGNPIRYGDGGWLLIRFSGTSRIIRVYCETMHGDKLQAILDDGMRALPGWW